MLFLQIWFIIFDMLMMFSGEMCQVVNRRNLFVFLDWFIKICGT